MQIKHQIVCVFLCCISFAFSEDYSMLIDTVLSKSPLYKNALLRYKSQSLSTMPDKFRWTPQPAVDFGYTGHVYMGTQKIPQSYAFKTSLFLLQSVPGGISIQGQADQFFGISKANIKPNQYEFSSSVAIRFPLYVVAPLVVPAAIKSELYTSRLNTEITSIELKIAKKNIIAQTVSTLSSYLLLKERVLLEEQKHDLQKKEAEADNRLWAMGKMSSFELSERKTKRYEGYLSLLQMRENFSNIVRNLYNFGLTEQDIPTSLDSWLTYWEQYIQTQVMENGLTDSLANKKNDISFYNSAERQLAALPQISFSASAVPMSSNSSGKNFTESFEKYWNSSNTWRWNFTASIRLALSPAASEYYLNSNFAVMQEMYHLSKEQAGLNYKTKQERYEASLGLLKKLSDKAMMDIEDSKNAILTAQALLNEGYLNQINFDYQKLSVELATNTFKELRLRYIVAVLTGY